MVVRITFGERQFRARFAYSLQSAHRQRSNPVVALVASLLILAGAEPDHLVGADLDDPFLGLEGRCPVDNLEDVFLFHLGVYPARKGIAWLQLVVVYCNIREAQ